MSTKETFEDYQETYFEFDLEGEQLELVSDCWHRQQKKIDELEKLFKDQGGCIVSAMSLLNKIQDLEAKLESERKATKFFSDALNEERLRHGTTEKKLEKAVDKYERLLSVCNDVRPSGNIAKAMVDHIIRISEEIKTLEELENEE